MTFVIDRIFQDLFEELMSKEMLISYLHDLEDLLFNSAEDEESLLDSNDEEKFYFLAKKLVKSLIPGKIINLIYILCIRYILCYFISSSSNFRCG